MVSVHLGNTYVCACSEVLVSQLLSCFGNITQSAVCRPFDMLCIFFVNTVMTPDNGRQGHTGLDDSGSTGHDYI